MNIRAAISRKPWILAVGVLALVGLWMGSGLFTNQEITSNTSQIRAPGDSGAAVKVQVETLVAESVTRIISVYGRTAPARKVEIGAETEGRVEVINARRGQRLSKGQAILTLDMRDRRAHLNQAEASVREHETAYQGQRSLQEDGYVSETQIAETLAKLEAARAELLRARIDLGNRIVSAPFDGVIQEREVEIGDFVRSGDKIVTFVDDLTLIVTGTLAEQEVAHIEVGESATAKLVTGDEVTGRVRYLSPVADEATRTFLIELEIDNTNGALLAGVTAEMQLESGDVWAHRISPALLTLDPDGEIGVMVVDAQERAKFMPVVIEKSGTNGVWVSGLDESSRVIIVGQGFVRPGQKIDAVRASSTTALAAESLL